MNKALDPQPLPRLALWRFQRRLRLKDVAEALECSTETVRRITLPFGDPGRRVPDEALLGRIVAYTQGEVTAADFYPAALNPPPRVASGGLP